MALCGRVNFFVCVENSGSVKLNSAPLQPKFFVSTSDPCRPVRHSFNVI